MWRFNQISPPLTLKYIDEDENYEFQIQKEGVPVMPEVSVIIPLYNTNRFTLSVSVIFENVIQLTKQGGT